MFRRTARSLFALTALVASATAAQSAALTVSSYDMPNGDGKAQGSTYNSYNYWDGTYTGSGDTTVDGSFLQGGTGALTDGVIATDPWNDVSNPAGVGPYVGWHSSPTITFHFANPVTINTIRLYVDDSNFGGVTAPSAVVVNGTSFDNSSYPLYFPGPQTITLAGLDIVGNSATLTLVDSSKWVFLSEVQFDGLVTTVPEAGNLAMMLAGLGLLGWASRRRA